MSFDPVPNGNPPHIDDTGEATLLARVRQGDRAAFDEVMEAHANALLRIAYGYVKSRADAEDLVQDVFLRIWETRATWEPHSTIGSYLAIAVRRRALNVLKHRQVESLYSNRTAVEEDCVASAPDAAVIAADEHDALQVLLDRLSDRARLVLLLRYEQKRSFAEIAEILEISVPATWQLVRRALAQARSLSGL